MPRRTWWCVFHISILRLSRGAVRRPCWRRPNLQSSFLPLAAGHADCACSASGTCLQSTNGDAAGLAKGGIAAELAGFSAELPGIETSRGWQVVQDEVGAELRAQPKFPRAACFAPAPLALADGTVFKGTSIGAAGADARESGCSTPRYWRPGPAPTVIAGQIVTLTSHIGNYGVSDEDVEAAKVFAAGLIIKDLPLLASKFGQTRFVQYLRDKGPPRIPDI